MTPFGLCEMPMLSACSVGNVEMGEWLPRNGDSPHRRRNRGEAQTIKKRSEDALGLVKPRKGVIP